MEMHNFCTVTQLMRGVSNINLCVFKAAFPKASSILLGVSAIT